MSIPRELALLPLVEAGDGADLLLSLIRADGSRVSVALGPAEAVAVAAELILAARLRLGRADWPPKVGEAAATRKSMGGISSP